MRPAKKRKKKQRNKETKKIGAAETKTFMHSHVSRFFVRAFFAATARL